MNQNQNPYQNYSSNPNEPNPYNHYNSPNSPYNNRPTGTNSYSNNFGNPSSIPQMNNRILNINAVINPRNYGGAANNQGSYPQYNENKLAE